MFASGFFLGFWQILAIVGVIALGIAVINRRAFSRLWESGSAQVGKAGRAAWNKDPVAIYQERIDKSADDIKEATAGLEQFSGMLETKKRQKADGEKEVADLDARIKIALKSGNRDRAATLVTQLNREKDHLATNVKLLGQYDSNYQSNVRKIKLARETIADAKDKAKRLGAELQMSEAEKQISDLQSKFQLNGANLDGLGEVEEAIQAKIDANRGAAIARADVGADGSAELEEREKIRQEQTESTLAQYEAEMKK